MISDYLGYLFLIIFLTILPIPFGIPWLRITSCNNRIILTIYAYIMGYFSFLAVFEVFFFTAAFLGVSFRNVSIALCLVLIMSLFMSCIYIKKTGVLRKLNELDLDSWKKMEFFYLFIFVFLLLYQIYYAVFYSRTYMADDGYVAFSSATIADNYINQTYFQNGDFNIHNASWVQRIIQAYNYYPAFLSFISGVNASIIAHTVIYTWTVVIAYAVYYIIADQLFDRRDNKLIFVSFLAVLFIWGYHSHYSLTFRLLGPNDSGKAFLAVVLSPFMMTIMYDVIKKGYKWYFGMQILVLSIDACSLTLGGVYTFASLLFGMIILTIIRNRNIKSLLYFLWGGSIPLAFALLYLIYR